MVEERSFLFWRNTLIALNVFYIVLGLIFLFFAIFTRLSTLILDPHLFIGLIILSVYLIALATLGIFAVFKHHQVLLFFYVILLLILFLFQFILACTYLTIRGGKKYQLLKDNYQNSRDRIQVKYNCCGFDNSTSFNRSESCRNLPCCQSVGQCCENAPMCYGLLNNQLDEDLKIIGSIMLMFTLLEISSVYVKLRFRNIRNPAIFIESDT